VTRLRTGVVLPTFRDDYVWPLGQPERPALAPFPVLGALAGRLDVAPADVGGPFLGTLVARVGLVPNDVLAAQFLALETLAPGRVIAGLGTGDRLNADENRAYGVPYGPAAERRAQMVALAAQLSAAGLIVWVAGGRVGRTVEACAAGAAMTVWEAEPALVAAHVRASDAVEVTWGGPPPTGAPSLDETVGSLHRAGVTWVVFGWPVDVGTLVSAARSACARGSGPASAGP